MATLPAELYYAEIEASTATLAALADYADPGLPIPACPGWTLRQLATHVGRAQRWAGQIVSARSAEFIEFRAVPDGRLPDDQSARGRWLTAGAARLVGALREAGDDMVWAFGSMLPAGFWARRMSHESMVHCADAHLAAGDEVAMTAELAADAIDEWRYWASSCSSSWHLFLLTRRETSRRAWPGVFCDGVPGGSGSPVRPSVTRRSGSLILSGCPGR